MLISKAPTLLCLPLRKSFLSKCRKGCCTRHQWLFYKPEKEFRMGRKNVISSKGACTPGPCCVRQVRLAAYRKAFIEFMVLLNLWFMCLWICRRFM